MLTLNGLFMFKTEAGCLNNLANETDEDGNMVLKTKIIDYIDEKGMLKKYAIISSQCYNHAIFRTMSEMFGIENSIKHKEGKQIIIEVDPIKYIEQDLRGYLQLSRYLKKNNNDGEGNNNIETLSRISPIRFSHLISVNPVNVCISVNTATSLGHNMIYRYELYKTHFKGMFSIDLDSIGRFTYFNNHGYKNINGKLITKYQQEKNEIIEFIDEEKKEILLTNEERKNRVEKYLRSLNYLAGGAKLANNFENIAPQFLILLALRGGNHILSNIVYETNNGGFIVDISVLENMLLTYKEDILSDIYIGRNPGYLEFYDSDINNLVEKLKKRNINIYYNNVKMAIDRFCTQDLSKIFKGEIT